MTQTDIVIIGAGAAGVGAALECAAHGLSCVVIEAADRVGGRAYTDTTSLPSPWDHGCHWLHCADVNPLVPIADRLGARYSTKGFQGAYTIWHAGAFLNQTELKASDAALGAAFGNVYEQGRAGRDVPVSEIIPDGGKWHEVATTILRLMEGDDLQDASAAGYSDYDDTNHDYPVLSGYGDLIGRMAMGLDIRTGVAVTGVTQSTTGASVETTDGTLHAGGVIVTASTSVIASGAIHFGAGPAADMAEKMADLPCGVYEKVAFAVDAVPEELNDLRSFMVDPGAGNRAVNFQVMREGAPLIVAHMAGAPVRDLTAEGDDALISFARERLTMAFGSDFTSRIAKAAPTGWTRNSLIRGSYSHARPGHAKQRRDMIVEDTGRVAFAGEAFSLKWQATAHGAYQSGRDVAARVAGHVSPS